MKLHLDEVFRHSPNAYMVLDAKLRYVAANDTYLRLTGSTLESIVGKDVIEAFPNDPNDPNNASALMLRNSFEQVLRTKKSDVLALIPYRVPIETEEGEHVEDRYWSATHTPILGDDGQVAYILQHTVDITEVQRLKQAAAAIDSQVQAGVLQRARLIQDTNRLLEEERRRLLHLFDQAPSFMVFLHGSDHVVEIANAAYLQLTGNRPLVGKPIREALPEVVEQGFVALLDSVFKSGEPFLGRAVKVQLQRRDGVLEERSLDFIYQPIRDAVGAVIGIFAQGHDITEQKRAEALLRESEQALRHLNEDLERRVAERTGELQEVNRELESFSYSVSHDLRAPLRHIMGFAQLLERRVHGALDEISRGYLKTISDAAKEGGKLVDDLLAFSRMGRAEMRLVPVALDQVVAEVLRELAPEYTARTVHFRVEALPTVQADPALLRLAMKNLLSNAIKYTRGRSEAHVEIAAETVDGEAHVWVRDDGVGFDMQYVDKLFGVFQRLHTSEEFEGTGIGLANVRRIITRHGGRVWAEGVVGSGATFHFALPVAVPAS